MNFPTTYGRNQLRAVNEFLSKVAFPLVRERYLLTRATIKKNYRSDPIISIDKFGWALNASKNFNFGLLYIDPNDEIICSIASIFTSLSLGTATCTHTICRLFSSRSLCRYHNIQA